MATPIITIDNVTVGEDQTSAAFVFRLSEPSLDTVSVRYYQVNNTADASTDYVSTGIQFLEFAPGQVTKTVLVDIRHDSVAEPTQNFYMVMDSPVNTIIGNSFAFATIIDNDASSGTPLVSVSDMVVDEQGLEASFVITLNKPSTSVVTVNYATENAGATAGSDYTATNGALSFAAGEVTKTVTVSLLDDSAAEASEAFNLRLSGLVNATTLDAVGTAVINENDATPVSSPVITVDDITVDEGQTYADFIVRLSAPSTEMVSVRYYDSNNTADASNDYVDSGTQFLNFAAGETVKTVRVTLRNDAVAEPAQNFYLSIDSPVNATIGNAYAIATIIDNDAPSGTPVVSVSDFVIDEQAKEASFVITLNKPSTSVVSLNYATENAGATAGSDYVAVNGSLAFAAGEVTKTIKVSLLDDNLAEASEGFNLRLSNLVNATTLDAVGTAVINENDATPVSSPVITVDNITVDEGQTYAEFIVRLSAPSTETVSVRYYDSNNTADASNDYVDIGTQFLHFAAGETVKTVRITLRNDIVAEPAQNFYLVMDSPVNATIGNSFAFATIIDNDAPSGTPVVSVSDFVIDEQAKEASFVISLNKPSTSVVSLNYATENAGATAGSDYVALNGSLNFAAGEVSKTVKVSLLDDNVAEASEAFNLRLSNLVNATTLDAVGTAVINENDATPVSSPVITVDDITVDEGQTYADFIVRLSAPSTETVSVRYYDSNNTADASNDYVDSGTQFLNFAAGETVKTVRVTLRNDIVAEPAQNFYLSIDSPVNATIGNSYAIATIVDNDAPSGTPVVSVSDFVIDEQAKEASFVITLNKPSTGVVTMNYATENGSAVAGSDFVATSGSIAFAAGEVSRTVKVTLTNDALAEQAETFGLRLTNLVGATSADPVGNAVIAANDATSVITPVISVADVVTDESRTYAEFVVRLSAPSTETVSVRFYDSNGTGDASNDYVDIGTNFLHFQAGETVKTVRITLRNDTAAEPAESFYLHLDSPVNAVVGNTLATAIMIDNDAPSGTPSVAVSDAVVDETAGLVSFAVTLDRPSAGAVTMNYATSNGTALAGSDFGAVTGSLSFAPGQTSATVYVPLLNDALAEGAERFTLVLSSLSGATAGDPVGTATVTASDAAAATVPVISATSPIVAENGGTAEFVVSLSAPSADVVSVRYYQTNGTADASNDYVYPGAQYLVFAPGETVKTVEVTIRDDAVAETDQTFNFVLDQPSGATIATPSVIGTIWDNDGAAVYSEGLSNDTYTFATASDRVIEAADGGIDTIEIGVTYTLPGVIENLTLTGNNAINGTGHGANNVIIGNNANNVLTGLGGNDTLDGLGGADTLVGGIGDDTYRVNNAGDVVTELAGQGTDRVEASLSWTLGDTLENLTLIGNAAINGTGNNGVNVLVGNAAANFLDGLGGPDTMTGGLGDDVYRVNNTGDTVNEVAGQGTDRIEASLSWSLGDTVENLTLIGNAAINGTGNNGSNVLIGNGAANTLDGLGGPDTMTGGLGDDVYRVNNAGDVVNETAGQGVDRIEASLSWTLGDTVENLTLIGVAAINGTGNNASNVLIGNSAANILDGLGGPDTMTGGLGDDVYRVNNAADTTNEIAGQGTDRVEASLTWTLGSTLENLTLTGVATINGTGNTGNNLMVGNGAANVLNGLDGNDTLRGGAGNDSLSGGNGLDRFVFDSPLNAATNVDTVSSFTLGQDTFVLSNTTFANVGPVNAPLAAAAFHSAAGATTAADASDRVIYNASSGDLFYDADGTGAGSTAVLFAKLTVPVALSAGNFVVEPPPAG